LSIVKARTVFAGKMALLAFSVVRLIIVSFYTNTFSIIRISPIEAVFACSTKT
jgi:hypothetical protein